MKKLLDAKLPAGEKCYTYRRHTFGGLDRRDIPDSGAMSDSNGVCPQQGGSLASAEIPKGSGKYYLSPVSMHPVGDNLLILYKTGSSISAAYHVGEKVYKTVMTSLASDLTRRSVVQFNMYTTPGDPLSGSYVRYGLVFPDKLMFKVDVEDESDFTFTPISAHAGQVPDIDMACVHLSRVFGVGEDRVFASAFNDFRDFELDTATDMSAGNAWATTAQSNVLADGTFTAIAVYDGHVMCFKRDFCHIINNNKNPFRIADLMAVGCVDARTVAECAGELYFASETALYSYSGGSPREIGAPLGQIDYTGSVAAAYRGRYYIYVPSMLRMYVYDPSIGKFGSIAYVSAYPVSEMCAVGEHLYILNSQGELMLCDSGYFGAWNCTSECMLLASSSKRRIRTLSVSATLSEGAELDVFVVRDGGERVKLLSGRTAGTHIYRTSVRGYASDCHRLFFSGKGEVLIHALDMKMTDAE